MANPKGNPQNLKGKGQSPKEAQINGRKGGKASGEAKRRKKAEREEAKKLFEYADEIGNMTLDELRSYGFNFPTLQGVPGSILVKKAIILRQMQMALDGNNQSYEHVRDQIGEKPVDKQEIVMSEKNPDEMSEEELDRYLEKYAQEDDE